MADFDKVFSALRNCVTVPKCRDCPWEECERFDCKKVSVPVNLLLDALKLLKEQEPIKPTINEYGEAYCVCGENVGIIPNSKSLPKILTKYCSECGRRMKWE